MFSDATCVSNFKAGAREAVSRKFWGATLFDPVRRVFPGACPAPHLLLLGYDGFLLRTVNYVKFPETSPGP